MASFWPFTLLYQLLANDTHILEREDQIMADIATVLADMAAIQRQSQATNATLATLVTEAEAIDTKMDAILAEIATLKAGGGVASQADLDNLEGMIQSVKEDQGAQTAQIQATQQAHTETLSKEEQA